MTNLGLGSQYHHHLSTTSSSSLLKPLPRHYLKFYIALTIIVSVHFSYWYFYYYLPPEYPTIAIRNITNPSRPRDAWCDNVPKLEPFHESIRYLTKVSSSSRPRCSEVELLFNSTRNTIIPLRNLEKRCCYRQIKRGTRHFLIDGQSKKCNPISSENPTKIPVKHEFIAIYCAHELVDMIPFVRLKPEVEAKLEHIATPTSAMNVLIIGLDAVSHMNFIRTFAKSHRFLVNNMSAIGMNWYNKVGDASYPNVVPALTGYSETETNMGCGRRAYFDSCPLIWKRFSEKGYRTALIEDAPAVALFNHLKNGFHDEPTDYYLRPFAVAADSKLGNFARMDYVNMCYGPRLIFEELMEYTKKFVETMDLEEKLYFYFMWSTSLTHNEMNDGYFGDDHLLKTLQWLKDGHLENTILILMSDHGMRSGRILAHLQGQLEDRLPLMYFVLPKMFQKRYPQAYQNLRDNSNSLVTTFDLHETLKDILEPDKNLKNDKIKKTEVIPNFLPRGISMFLPIPATRTCAQAGVPQNYCACNKMQPVDLNSAAVKVGAKIAVEHMNNLLKNYKQCMRLHLSRIVSALKVGYQFSKWRAYQLKFETVPGNGSFDAMVSSEFRGPWEVSGTIGRTNLYGNQSHCVHEIELKYYCYCKNREKESGKNYEEKS